MHVTKSFRLKPDVAVMVKCATKKNAELPEHVGKVDPEHAIHS
jgi:hypothetical protein